MLQGTLAHPVYAIRHRALPRALFIALALLLAALASALWYGTGAQLRDLGSPGQMRLSGTYAQWAKGSVIVLVRHAERCDRSRTACLAAPSGITVDGSLAAIEVGQGLEQLGLTGTDLLSSPLLRTRQTANFMFAKAIPSQDWLARCDGTFSGNLLGHKRAGHNLVLVTHSGCIEHLERQLGVTGHERSVGYASALFLSEGRDGQLQVLGRLNASQWRSLANGKGA